MPPGARRRLPAARVRRRPPDQLVPAEKVDEAVVSDPGDEDLSDLTERRVELKRAAQPLAYPLEQAEPVRLALGVAAPGLADEHHHAVDAAPRAAQRHRELAQEPPGAVAAARRQRVFPRHPAEHLAGELVGLALLGVRDEPDRVERPAGQRRGLPG